MDRIAPYRTLDAAVDLLEEYRDQFKIHEEHFPAAAVHFAFRLEDEPGTEMLILNHLEEQDHLFHSAGESLRRNVRKTVKKLRGG